MAAKEYLMNFGRAAAGQHYFVGFISLLSPQARGTSVKSWLFQSGRKGIFDESMVNWGPSLRSLPAIFTGQGHIYIVILISECVCKEWLGPASRWQHYNCQYLIFVLFYDWLLKICWFPIQVGQILTCQQKDNVFPKRELVKEDVLISNLSGFHFGPNIDL